MKRYLLITGVAVVIVLTVRLFYKKQNEFEGERESYVKNLNYNFSAKVDSIIVLNGKRGRGFLVFEIKDEGVSRVVEDSLNRSLQNHDWMRFMFFNLKGKGQIFLENIFVCQVGDSVTVNSNEDRFSIYRENKSVMETTVTSAAKFKVSWEKWARK